MRMSPVGRSAHRQCVSILAADVRSMASGCGAQTGKPSGHRDPLVPHRYGPRARWRRIAPDAARPEFAIRLGGNELMNSRLSGTERRWRRSPAIGSRRGPRPNILIGGLGMGFTLRGGAGRARAGARIYTLLNWCPRWSLGRAGRWLELFGDSLTDPRLTIHEKRRRRVDPRGESRLRRHPARCRQRAKGHRGKANDRLYDFNRLAATHRALMPAAS